MNHHHKVISLFHFLYEKIGKFSSDFYYLIGFQKELNRILIIKTI